MPASLLLSQVEQTVSSRLSHLSRPQARVLSWWCFAILSLQGLGMGLSTVSTWLGMRLSCNPEAITQRFREWCYNVEEKKRSSCSAVASRKQLEVSQCFAPLLRWIVDQWDDSKHLVLVLDATTLSHDLVILAVSVVYRGYALPVAWHMQGQHERQGWQGPWLRLLRSLDGVIPLDWTVLVMADSGLYARWLYEGIRQRGWHPFLRLPVGSARYRPAGQDRWWPLRSALQYPGQQSSGRVSCFGSLALRLECTLLVGWAEGYEQGWLIVTDLPPANANAAWYRMRFWIEPGFKGLKRGCWQWHRSQMRLPWRAERQWLVLAVASIWTVSQASEAEALVQSLRPKGGQPLPATHWARRSWTGAVRPRKLSVQTMGILLLRVRLESGQGFAVGHFEPDRWPEQLPKASAVAKRWHKRRKKGKEEARRAGRLRAQRRRAKETAAHGSG